MKYSVKEIIRQWVLLTNKVWPFSCLNRLVYRVAIRCFLIKTRKFSQVKSVYLRPSMSTNDWTPGISDIDLTIVVEEGLDDHEEWVFLKSFWEEYRYLQKIFPMLGEAEVLDQSSLDLWSRFGTRGYEFRYWELLYGQKVSTLRYEVDPLSLQRAYLNQAFFLFKYHLRVSNRNASCVGWPLRRNAAKIMKYLNIERVDQNYQKEFSPYTADGNYLLAKVLLELEAAIKEIYPDLFYDEAKRLSESQHHKSIKRGQFPSGDDLIQKMGVSVGNVDSIISLPFNQSNDLKSLKFLFLLKSGLKLSQVEEAVDRVYQSGIKGQELIVLTPLVLNYLSFQDPYFYKSFLNEGEVLFGRDSFLKEPFENKVYLFKTSIEMFMVTLISLRSNNILSKIQSSRFMDIKFLQYILRDKLSVERAQIMTDIDQLLKNYEGAYPDVYAQILKVTNSGSEVEKFALLKKLIVDVRDHLGRQDNMLTYWNVDMGGVSN